MTPSTDTPLTSPPRRVRLRRMTKNVRRAYRLIFALVIIISGGWAALDLIHWHELSRDQRMLSVGFCFAAVMAFAILRLVEHPSSRELRLARSGYISQGEITSIDLTRGRRRRNTVGYTFRTVAGDTIQGRSVLPRRFPAATLEVGQIIEVLYDPARPQLNKPRLALEHVEFA